jgi:aminopeptidase YwaD
MQRFMKAALGAFLLLVPAASRGQMTPWFQWTFLPQSQIDLIAGEASGETALGHVIVLGGMPRDRKAAEYAGTFFESQYVVDRLKEYGLADAAIVRFPGGESWDGVSGELWEVKPGLQKLASYTDLRAMLATGSNTADVTAELVWVGDGIGKDLENVDLKGKIAVTSGPAGQFRLQTEAEGVISFNSPRPLFDPLGIPWSGIGGGGKSKFAFFLPPREGVLLRDRLRRGEKITVRAKVEAAPRKYEQQVVVATIPGAIASIAPRPASVPGVEASRGTAEAAVPGAETAPDEIILSAHLFEGYAMQGANDNYSGDAAILDAARTIRTLIADGRLPRPKRTIRFLWAPEISGTGAWVKANPDVMRRTLCNINLDMVGIDLQKSLAFFCFMRTTYGNPHYLNDVLENVFRYVGETNRSYVANGMTGQLNKRIVAPSGSEQPMPWYAGTHFGSSDHEVFNDWGVGVPGVVLNTWPDQWYHTSEDRPDKLDATQMKRAVAITAAAAYIIASADDRMAGQIAAEVVSNAAGRIGHQIARGAEEMKRAAPEALPTVFKKVRAYVEAAGINERATLDTVRQLAADKTGFAAYLEGQKAAVTGIEQAGLKAVDNEMRLAARLAGIPAVALKPNDLEKKAAAIVPKPTSKIKENGYQGYQTLIQQAQSEMSGQSAPAKPAAAPPAARGGGRGPSGEIRLLCDGRNSALDIKKLLDTELAQETSLETVLSQLEILKKAGLVVF